MSTPSDAAYNRCRPVPLWNGSSNASRRRRATTRCWKDCRREARGERREAGRREAGRRARITVLVAAILLVPTLLLSQQTAPATPAPVAPTHPEVVNLTLKGVKVVKQSELLQSISTTASHCNGFILIPFCWISKAKYLFTKEYLDHKELERDVLRI